jgi:hypothetical protein
MELDKEKLYVGSMKGLNLVAVRPTTAQAGLGNCRAKQSRYFGFQILRAATFKSTIFWGKELCNAVEDCQRFGGIKQRARRSKHMIFDPDYGGNMFLRNIG